MPLKIFNDKDFFLNIKIKFLKYHYEIINIIYSFFPF